MYTKHRSCKIDFSNPFKADQCCFSCRNLDYHCEEDELEEKFADFGDVSYARIVIDRETGVAKGKKKKEVYESCYDLHSHEESEGTF